MTIALGIVIATSAIVLYIILGYPLLLSLNIWRKAPPVQKDPRFYPSVSIVMAVHNGEDLIEKKLAVLRDLEYPRHLLEIIVISDGSTDNTDPLVRSFSSMGITLLRVPRGGKAAALNKGIAFASGEILFFTDVRQSLEPSALRLLVSNLADSTVGAASGQLKLRRAQAGEQADMELYWRYEVWARTRQSEIFSLFNGTGCIYAMRRSLAQRIPPDTIADDAILPLTALFRGYRIVYEPGAIAYDSPAVAGTEFRRRLRTLAGLWQVFVRCPELFTFGNRMRLHFLSHKFGRLILPWALLMLLTATIALPHSSYRTTLLLIELLLPLLAILDRIMPPGFPLKRLSSPAHTFLIMNLAALLAMAVFFVPATVIWKPTRVEVDK